MPFYISLMFYLCIMFVCNYLHCKIFIYRKECNVSQPATRRIVAKAITFHPDNLDASDFQHSHWMPRRLIAARQTEAGPNDIVRAPHAVQHADKKARTSSRKASGRSVCTRCPAPAIVATRAAGNQPRIKDSSSRSRNGERSPATKSAGPG